MLSIFDRVLTAKILELFMTKSVEKRDLDVDELISGTADSLKQALNGDTVSDEGSIRERVTKYLAQDQ